MLRLTDAVEVLVNLGFLCALILKEKEHMRPNWQFWIVTYADDAVV